MSIDANEYLIVPEGGTPEIVPPPQRVGEAVPLPFDRYIIELRVQCHNTAAGVRFLEWLRDKIRADQESAKAFDVVPRLGPFPTPQVFDPHRPPTTGDLMPPNPTTICGLAIINEGDAAPSADVVSIAAESQFRIP